MVELRAFVDGACSGNPGPGGWGVVLQARKNGKIVKKRELSGGEKHTTNNRMELTAAIRALESLTRSAEITMVTDSQYVKNGITRWIKKWKSEGWSRRSGEPVKNVDLWRQLDHARERHKVKWEWTRGHAGDPGNERADQLARKGMKPFLR